MEFERRMQKKLILKILNNFGNKIETEIYNQINGEIIDKIIFSVTNWTLISAVKNSSDLRLTVKEECEEKCS